MCFVILVYLDFDYMWSISKLVGIKGMNVHMYHHLSVRSFQKTLISQVWSAGGWNHYFHSLFANCCSYYPKFWWLFNISNVILFSWQIFFPQPQCKNSFILALQNGTFWSSTNFEIPTFFLMACRQKSREIQNWWKKVILTSLYWICYVPVIYKFQNITWYQ